MSKRSFLSGVLAVSIFAMLAGVVICDEIETAGQKIMSSNENAVIWVRLVINQKMVMNGVQMQQQETKSEVVGTIVDPSGLTLVSLSGTNPSEIMKSIMEQSSGREDMKFEMNSDLGEIKMVLSDGTEIPAKVVLRDKDWDMAFLRPIERQANPLPFVDLATSYSPKILEEVFVVDRMGKTMNNSPSISIFRVKAIANRPRTFFSVEGETSFGSPVFSKDGKIIGINLMRFMKTGGGGLGMGAMLGGKNSLGIQGIILPASYILDASKQAATATGTEAENPDKKDNPDSKKENK